jgi:hypothetical protein
MARYMKGQILDGKNDKKYRFLGGDDTDPKNFEEIKPFTQPTMAQSMDEELDSRNFLGKAAAGLGTAANRVRYGVKDLFTDLSPEDKERLGFDKQIAATPGGMAGSIAGDVAMTYLPFSKAAQWGAKIPGAAGVATRVGGAGALGGGWGALTSPEERGDGAFWGALGGAGGSLAGEFMSGAFRPAAGSAAARMADEGVPLTMGQSAGGMTKRVEDGLRAGSSAVANRQAEALEKWSQNVVSKSLPSQGTSVAGTPIPAKVTGIGRNAIAEGAHIVDDAYDDAFGKMGQLVGDDALIGKLHEVVDTYKPKITPSDFAALKAEMNRIGGEFGGKVGGVIDPRAMKDVRRSFDKLASDAATDGKGRLADAYKAVITALDDVSGRQFPEGAAAVKAVDDKYADFLRVQRAAGKIGAEEGVFTPKQLLASVRDLDRSADKRAFARGSARPPLLAEAEEAAQVLGPTIPQVGPGTAEKLLIPLAAQNWVAMMPHLAAQGLYQKPMQKFMTGAYGAQQGIDPAWMAALAAAGARKR